MFQLVLIGRGLITRLVEQHAQAFDLGLVGPALRRTRGFQLVPQTLGLGLHGLQVGGRGEAELLQLGSQGLLPARRLGLCPRQRLFQAGPLGFGRGKGLGRLFGRLLRSGPEFVPLCFQIRPQLFELGQARGAVLRQFPVFPEFGFQRLDARLRFLAGALDQFLQLVLALAGRLLTGQGFAQHFQFLAQGLLGGLGGLTLAGRLCPYFIKFLPQPRSFPLQAFALRIQVVLLLGELRFPVGNLLLQGGDAGIALLDARGQRLPGFLQLNAVCLCLFLQRRQLLANPVALRLNGLDPAFQLASLLAQGLDIRLQGGQTPALGLGFAFQRLAQLAGLLARGIPFGFQAGLHGVGFTLRLRQLLSSGRQPGLQVLDPRLKRLGLGAALALEFALFRLQSLYPRPGLFQILTRLLQFLIKDACPFLQPGLLGLCRLEAGTQFLQFGGEGILAAFGLLPGSAHRGQLLFQPGNPRLQFALGRLCLFQPAAQHLEFGSPLF